MKDTSSIEVREGWKRYYLLCFLGILFIFSFAFILPDQRKESIDFFFGRWSFAKLPFFLMFALGPVVCLFYYFDNRVKVRIDGNGIWSRRKGNIAWEDIWYFDSTLYKMNEGDKFQLRIRLKDTETRLDKEETLKFRRMDKSFDEIRSVVEYYAAKHGIEDLGHGSGV